MMEPRRPHSLAVLTPKAFTWALAIALTLATFCIPQNPTLNWFAPPADSRQLLLQIKCASDRESWVQLFYDTGLGFRFQDSARFLLSPTREEFTQTFLLPDAPILRMRISGVPYGGTLRISSLRVIDRSGTERLRFARGDCIAETGVAAILGTTNGWMLQSEPRAQEALVRLDLPVSFAPEGFLSRHFLCTSRSLAYLTIMLSLLLLIVRAMFPWPPTWQGRFTQLGVLVCFGFLLSIVGNRGLIREAVRLSGYAPPPPSKSLQLEIELNSSGPTPTQLFWNVGRGIDGRDSCRVELDPDRNLQTVRFDLPSLPLQSLRLDPRDNVGFISMRNLRITDAHHFTRAEIPLTALRPYREIASISFHNDRALIETTPSATDPILIFDDSALAAINRAMRSSPP